MRARTYAPQISRKRELARGTAASKRRECCIFQASTSRHLRDASGRSRGRRGSAHGRPRPQLACNMYTAIRTRTSVPEPQSEVDGGYLHCTWSKYLPSCGCLFAQKRAGFSSNPSDDMTAAAPVASRQAATSAAQLMPPFAMTGTSSASTTAAMAGQSAAPTNCARESRGGWAKKPDWRG
eukprot:3832693-Pleurochrysis_carterae.AAC.6